MVAFFIAILFTASPLLSRYENKKAKKGEGKGDSLIPLKEFDFLRTRSGLTPEGGGSGERGNPFSPSFLNFQFHSNRIAGIQS